MSKTINTQIVRNVDMSSSDPLVTAVCVTVPAVSWPCPAYTLDRTYSSRPASYRAAPLK